MLISTVQQSDLVIYVYIHILFRILFHYGLSQHIEYSSLCYTVGLCCLSILHMIVFIRTSTFKHFLFLSLFSLSHLGSFPSNTWLHALQFQMNSRILYLQRSWGIIYSSISNLFTKKLRPRDQQWVEQGATVRQQQVRDEQARPLTPKTVFFLTYHTCPHCFG